MEWLKARRLENGRIRGWGMGDRRGGGGAGGWRMGEEGGK